MVHRWVFRLGRRQPLVAVDVAVAQSEKRNAQTLLGGAKADGGNGEGGQPFSLMTPNGSVLAPMIPAMEHRVFSVLTIAVVAGVPLLVVLYLLSEVLMLIASYGD
jgi:hypothetical protein